MSQLLCSIVSSQNSYYTVRYEEIRKRRERKTMSRIILRYTKISIHLIESYLLHFSGAYAYKKCVFVKDRKGEENCPNITGSKSALN